MTPLLPQWGMSGVTMVNYGLRWFGLCGGGVDDEMSHTLEDQIDRPIQVSMVKCAEKPPGKPQAPRGGRGRDQE